MFCPRCGRQAAEEVSFCSGCGLPLDAAAELVEAGGLPERARAEAEAAALTPRQRGVRKGLMLTAGGLLLVIGALLLTAFKEDLFVFLIPSGVFLVVGVMRILYGLLLEGHTPEKKPAARAAIKAPASPAELARGHAGGGELPHARTVPASLYARPADTSDMHASPLSVTENTTKLLDEQ